MSKTDAITIADYAEHGWHVQCEGQCQRVVSEPVEMTQPEFADYVKSLHWRITRGGNLLCDTCVQAKTIRDEGARKAKKRANR